MVLCDSDNDLSIFKFQSDSINTRMYNTVCEIIKHFKFQSDSINTTAGLDMRYGTKDFKFQSDSINTPCSKTPLKPQVTTLISVDLRNKHLYALTS